MAKQKFKAYVGFVDGEINTEDTVDECGDFIGITVYREYANAAERFDDVREVELVIVRRVKQPK